MIDKRFALKYIFSNRALNYLGAVFTCSIDNRNILLPLN